MKKKGLQLLFFILIGTTVFLFFYFDLNYWFRLEHIEVVKNYFVGIGMMAPIYMAAIYILFNIAAIPRVFFTIFSGYVFGLTYGFLFAWFATLAGLIVTFITIRYLFRDQFEGKYGDKKLIEKLNLQIEKSGIWIVIFLRAIYIVPSSILNYSFGFTKIKTITYIIGSAIGFIPVVFINVYLGISISEGIYSENTLNNKIIIGIIAILIVVIYLYKDKMRNKFIFK